LALTSVNIGAIQALAAKVEALEKEIEKLKKKN
jgi:hypothetical protein